MSASTIISNEDKMSALYSSVEVIYHFTCKECKCWWSVAAMELYWTPKVMFCPHCGYKSSISK